MEGKNIEEWENDEKKQDEDYFINSLLQIYITCAFSWLLATNLFASNILLYVTFHILCPKN